MINNGADVNFKAKIKSIWIGFNQIYQSLFSDVSGKLAKFKDEKQIIRFIEIFVKAGYNINQVYHHKIGKNSNSRKSFLM